ncbi:condensation domain-containing protein, partial [Streptomyces cinnamoneus]
PGTLALVVHRLAADTASGHILREDLTSAWQDLAAGRRPGPAPAGTSYRRWSRLLTEAAGEPARAGELALWRSVLSTDDPLLADRPLNPATDVHGTARELELLLPAETTGPLLERVPAAFNATAEDVLLTGLALAVARWRRERGLADGTAVLVGREGSGRERLTEGTDVSRTVGWFSGAHPVAVDPGELPDDAWAGGPALGPVLKAVKEQLRAVPDNGIGYGMLRHLNPATGRKLAGQAEPQVGFAYEDAPAPAISGIPADTPLRYALGLRAVAGEGPDGDRLLARWTWPDALFTERDVRELAELWFTALQALVTCAGRPEAGGLTPSDLSLLALSQDEIDEFESDLS